MKHGKGQLISNSSSFTAENGEAILFPYEYDGQWVKDKKHGKGTIIVTSKLANGTSV